MSSWSSGGASVEAEQRVPLDDLVAAGADADRRDPGADQLLDALDVALGVGRQLLERAAGGDVLPPAGELLVDRRRVVEVALAHRHLVVPHAVDVVGHAHRHLSRGRSARRAW